jgi:hypothetical protein
MTAEVAPFVDPISEDGCAKLWVSVPYSLGVVAPVPTFVDQPEPPLATSAPPATDPASGGGLQSADGA